MGTEEVAAALGTEAAWHSVPVMVVVVVVAVVVVVKETADMVETAAW